MSILFYYSAIDRSGDALHLQLLRPRGGGAAGGPAAGEAGRGVRIQAPHQELGRQVHRAEEPDADYAGSRQRSARVLLLR